jgi:hypothetical protein
MAPGKKSHPTKQPDSASDQKNSTSDQDPEVTLESAGQVAVTYSANPAKGPPAKQIHERRRLPDIPDAPPKKGGSE